MSREEPSEKLILTEQQVRRVIELASRMPPSNEGMTVAELRQIARELDIDDGPFDRALNVVLTSGSRPTSRPSWLSHVALRLGRLIDSMLPQRARLLTLSAIAAFFGWLDAYAGSLLREVINGVTIMRGSTSYLVVRLSILLGLLTIANSLSRRLTGSRKRYLAETVATWTSLAVAWSLTAGYMTGDLLRFVAVCIAAFGVWGWLIIRPANRDAAITLGADSQALPSSTAAPHDDPTGRFDLSVPDTRQRASRLVLKTLFARGAT